jgi:phospholipid/cholesterol/gamma-HCH transport system ATP-binding protein
MIRFDNVTKSLGGRVILDGVDLDIRDGETFVILGSSGAGKSVSLKHMVRLLTPDEGEVWVDDACVSTARGRALEEVRSRFGYLFQGAALLQWLTVGDNVGLPLRERTHMSPEDVDAEVQEKLHMVNLGDAFAKFPSELSGGMRKRVGLARAIVTKPDIILYDEPTSGLDPVTSRTIDELIDGLRRELGVTSVVVTHDLHSALAIGTRLAMLHGGRIVETATPEAFIKSEHPVVRDFLAAQYINRAPPWEETRAS